MGETGPAGTQGQTPEQNYVAFQGLTPEQQQGYVQQYQSADPTTQQAWLTGTGQTDPTGGVNNPNYPPAPVPAPGYGQLRSDAVNAYLGSGGPQANVDAYFAANPTPNYDQLAGHAAQWYTDPNRYDPSTDYLRAQVMPADGSPMPPMPANVDQRNQNVANYFGVAPPPPGQNYNFERPIGGIAPVNPGNPWDDLRSPAFRTWFDQELRQGRSPGLTSMGADPSSAYGTYQTRDEQAALMAQYEALPPEVRAAYVQYYMTLSPEEQVTWRQAFGTDNAPVNDDPWATYGVERNGPNNWVGGEGSHEMIWEQQNAPQFTWQGGVPPPPGYAGPAPLPPPRPRPPPADPRIGSLWQ